MTLLNQDFVALVGYTTEDFAAQNDYPVPADTFDKMMQGDEISRNPAFVAKLNGLSDLLRANGVTVECDIEPVQGNFPQGIPLRPLRGEFRTAEARWVHVSEQQLTEGVIRTLQEAGYQVKKAGDLGWSLGRNDKYAAGNPDSRRGYVPDYGKFYASVHV